MSTPKVAVIEDEKPILDMYLMKLKAAGFEARGAADGAEGLELIHSFHPDLVLLDLRMPRMGGHEMLRKLREAEQDNNVIVVVLTNLSQTEASLDLRLLKVEKYIVKAHSTPTQIVEEVKNILFRHGKLADR